jgi:transcriptional regulator with XRE-family HTH domain
MAEGSRKTAILGDLFDIPMQKCHCVAGLDERSFRFTKSAIAANGLTRKRLCYALTQGETPMNTSNQMRACRALLGWEQKELAAASGLNRSTIQRMERLGPAHWSAINAAKVRHALENGGIIFIKSGLEGAGIRLTRSREFLEGLAEIGSSSSSDVHQKSAAAARFENFRAEVHRFFKGDAYETEQIRSKLSHLKAALEFEVARRGDDHVSTVYIYVCSLITNFENIGGANPAP